VPKFPNEEQMKHAAFVARDVRAPVPQIDVGQWWHSLNAVRRAQAEPAAEAVGVPDATVGYILNIVPGASDNTQICKILEIMESSRECQSCELARRFDTSMAQINDVLCTLAEEGLVRMSNHSSRIIRLERLSFASQPPTPLVSDTATQAAVSTPPVAPRRRGRLRDYEASLLSVHSLAMLVRPSN
jgi:hypothetical protein